MTKDHMFKNGYSAVNGLNMYYEIYGEGKPLVLIHGGGSTIKTSFGRIIPQLAFSRQVIAMELQAHGRTNDRDKDLSFEQDADDVAQLLENLQIVKADFMGFSNGGQTVIEIALRHPHLVRKTIVCSSFYKRSAVVPQFWESFEGNLQLRDMPHPLQDEFLKVNNNPAALLNMFNKDVNRMRNFKDWSDEQIRSIQSPTLIVNGDSDLGNHEHMIEMSRIIPDCTLAILPGGHGKYLGEITTLNSEDEMYLIIPLVNQFLN